MKTEYYMEEPRMTATPELERFLHVPDHDKSVRIVEVGDDGNFLVAVGCFDKRLFAAHVITYMADMYGHPHAEDVIEDGGFEYIAEQTRHHWAKYDWNDQHKETWVTWEGVTGTTPGAFPITLFDQEI